jgi:hypothetical protein
MLSKALDSKVRAGSSATAAAAAALMFGATGAQTVYVATEQQRVNSNLKYLQTGRAQVLHAQQLPLPACPHQLPSLFFC